MPHLATAGVTSAWHRRRGSDAPCGGAVTGSTPEPRVPVPQSTHRSTVRLFIDVDDSLDGRFHSLQRLCQSHRPYREVVVVLA